MSDVKLLISIFVSLTIAEMMFAMGLRLSFRELISSVKQNGILIMRLFIANFLLIPIITLFLIWIFELPPFVAVGLIILGAAPAAPFAPPFTAFAKGNTTLATAMMVILAACSFIITPLLLHLSLKILPGNEGSIHVDHQKLIGTLFIIQLLPLCFGVMMNHFKSNLASRMVKPASRISKVLNGMMVVVIAIFQFNVVAGIDLLGFTIMLLLVIVGVVIGWYLAGRIRQNSIAGSIVTSMRNMSLSMGIATTSFSGTPVITTVLAFSFIAGFGLLLFSFLLRITISVES